MASIDSFLKALVTHDSSALPLAKNFKATENAKPSDLKSGLWKTASKIGTYAFSVIDKETGQHGWAGLILRGEGEGSIVSIRLKINDAGEIEESEIIDCMDRFPGSTATDPKTCTKFRESFSTKYRKKNNRQETIYKPLQQVTMTA